MFIFLSICDSGDSPLISVEIGYSGVHGLFPATLEGARAAGRHIATHCPGADSFSCSSSIDFAHEYGVPLTGDEICNEVLLGLGLAAKAF